jgi:UDP-glucose:(heptosyl)LPS alpha-1,3-glucosyltransferase
MKIALVKRRYSLRHGGSERYCVNLARQLQVRGHQVTVIGEAIDDELKAEVSFISVSVNRLTSSTRNRSFAQRCGHAAHDGRFDLVYGLGRSFGLDAVRVTERLQAHWVNVYYENSVNRLLQRLNPRHRTLIDLERTIYRSPHVRRIVTQSQLDRRLVQQYYGIPDEKLRTIYNGVDTSVFHPGVRAEAQSVRDEWGVLADEPLLIFASMDFEGKGLRYLLQALKACRHREARLLVLGTGPERKFARIARDLGLGSRVLFAGRQPAIQRYYGAGDLFLLPTAYEPFPNVNLEAMACGTPVMTTNTAGGADIVVHGENGYLVSAMQAVDDIAACLDHHFSLPAARRQAMSVRSWETARPMTLARNVEQTLELFEEVLLEKFRV